ncbi:MAG: lysine--tRNA ligase [Helicobacteraceae bacterium]|nr:lysine--tRNA ligase [Helicobacteraceae bacterium]
MIPDLNSYVEGRIGKLNKLRELGENPFDNDVRRDMSLAQFRETHADLLSGAERNENRVVSIVGRLKLLRVMGKVSFAQISDQSGSLQLYISQAELGSRYDDLKKIIEVGDIIEAAGYGFLTKTGELTLHIKTLKVLTKSIRPLPEKFHGIQDIESRSRQRYLDLIMNEGVLENFIYRSRLISSVRNFFEKNGFVEVETPMLHPIPGGANARPFITHHNALNVDRFLRIAPELYLKRLIVGGFEAVYEINRCFRNEGMDSTHNPEFTMIEFYWAYHTCSDLIVLTEKLFAELTRDLGVKTVCFKGRDIDLSVPFKRYSYDRALIEIGGISEGDLNDAVALKRIALDLRIAVKESDTIGRIKGGLFDRLVEENLIAPVFITDFPIEISPLARRNDRNPALADRFELFIGGYEIANGFSELNDPIDQYNRFKEQVKEKEGGNDEGMFMDEDYITALSYGMPPAAGEGIGIDRLAMILTGSETIRDVLLFPAMRPTGEGDKN